MKLDTSGWLTMLFFCPAVANVCPACPACEGGYCTKPGCGFCPHKGAGCGEATKCCQSFGSCPSCAGGHCTGKGSAMCPHSGFFGLACCTGATLPNPPPGPQGRWGPGCEGTCPFNCANSTCSQETGYCLGGCSGKKWHGVTCVDPCSRTCAGGQCEQLSGACSNGCMDGYYGSTSTTPCDKQCPLHCGVNGDGTPVCNAKTGSCDGWCVNKEWAGDRCDENQELREGCDFSFGKTLSVFAGGVAPEKISCGALASRFGAKGCFAAAAESGFAIAGLVIDFPLFSMACLGSGAFTYGACEFVQDKLVDKAAEYLCSKISSWLPHWLRNLRRTSPESQDFAAGLPSMPGRWPSSFLANSTLRLLNLTTGVQIGISERLSTAVDLAGGSIQRRSSSPTYDLTVAINCSHRQGTAVVTDTRQGNCSSFFGGRLAECAALGLSQGKPAPTSANDADQSTSYLSFLLERIFNVTSNSMQPVGTADQKGHHCFSAETAAMQGTVTYCQSAVGSAPLNITAEYPLAGTRIEYVFDAFVEKPSTVPFLPPCVSCQNESFNVIGNQGADCSSTCDAWNASCSESVTTGNSTQPFQELGIVCDADPRKWFSKEQPSYVSDPADSNFGKCLGWKTGIPKAVSCSAKHPAARRLCRCIPLKPSFNLIGDQGQSCTSACASRNATCVNHILTGDSTQPFQDLGINCTPDSRAWWARDQPCYVSDPKDKNYGKCLGYTKVPMSLSCDSRQSTVRRLCSCRPSDQAVIEAAYAQGGEDEQYV
eukprot:TRINITY_DN16685_c0_g1_i1.p1 TRINITY_DN16685_c0_g1~~TRINITY_DN16685_c0_g1_i1.p1  ORF type:complete len:767 (+),score=109.74 TRINITY_DN16685_c0_g1_i1:43-2343(+)